jgi:hypothetical protein
MGSTARAILTNGRDVDFPVLTLRRRPSLGVRARRGRSHVLWISSAISAANQSGTRECR